jgi:hypothetical protein
MPGARAVGQGCAIHLALPACLGESKTSFMSLAQELTECKILKLDGRSADSGLRYKFYGGTKTAFSGSIISCSTFRKRSRLKNAFTLRS